MGGFLWSSFSTGRPTLPQPGHATTIGETGPLGWPAPGRRGRGQAGDRPGRSRQRGRLRGARPPRSLPQRGTRCAPDTVSIQLHSTAAPSRGHPMALREGALGRAPGMDPTVVRAVVVLLLVARVLLGTWTVAGRCCRM